MSIIRPTAQQHHMVSTSAATSWLCWVCRSLSFFFKTDRPDITMFSGRRDPQDWKEKELHLLVLVYTNYFIINSSLRLFFALDQLSERQENMCGLGRASVTQLLVLGEWGEARYNGCVTLALPRPHTFGWRSLNYPAQRKGLFGSLPKNGIKITVCRCIYPGGVDGCV